jgi:tetratricopeptide (TPR) repeat protein
MGTSRAETQSAGRVCLISSVLTVSADPVNDCTKGQGEDVIRGCTSLLNSHRYTGHNLSVIYNIRGVAYMNMGDSEKAMEDFNEAIRLDKRFILPR